MFGYCLQAFEIVVSLLDFGVRNFLSDSGSK